ncbi:B12-binding domain-containing radical SAM protein [Candidatus Omnitrophota bacterium]
MLTLVEPYIIDSLTDRPHLGCAMLISACQEKGIKTTLVKGQTRCLRDMLVNDSEELWHLIQDLKENDIKKIGITAYKKTIEEKGLRQFQDELKSIYQYVIIDKNPRHYFNSQMIVKFNNIHNIFIAIYFYYLKELNYTKLKIIDRYVSEIIKSDPRYIGFSLQGSFGTFTRTIRKRVREVSKAPIIVGGALTPFINVKNLDKIFEKEYFNYLVIGAGEHALPSLIETLENNKEPKGIVNVFYKKDGEVKGNDLGVIDDLDSLPYPDYSQFDLDLYLTPKRILPLQTVRGCSWRKCAFCSHHAIDFGNFKTFSIGKIIDIIRHLQNNYNCSHFTFHNEELTASQAKRISEAMLDNNLNNIYITTYARPTEGYNNNSLLRLMRKAGFSLIHWGVESGCQRVLDLMNKGIRISIVKQVLKKSSENKIANLCFIFFGFPGETKKEAQQTVKFLKENADSIEDILYNIFYLNLNSPIGKNPEKWGINIKNENSFSAKSGMSCNESRTFLTRFKAECEANSIKIASNKLIYALHGHKRRMLRFLNSSYQLYSNMFLLKRIKKGELNNIFPIILGEIKTKDSRTIFYPINIKETDFINQLRPEKGRILNRLEEKIFILSDGMLSIENIVSTVYAEFKSEHEKEYVCKKCTDFLHEVFLKNWALGFAKSWQK